MDFMKMQLKRIFLWFLWPLGKAIELVTRPARQPLEREIQKLQRNITRNALLAAEPLVQRVRQLGEIKSLEEAEFKVFSQWGEDGILQYLIHRVPIPNRVFVEFGVEDYSEANTRFLLMHDNWEGLIMDADPTLESRLKEQELYWRHQLKAKSSFITAENINDLIREAGIQGDIGLLSVDIDGNDYWVWKAISVISPRIVVCEYNAVFETRHEITTPYRPDFYKTRHHYSNLCFGASLPAICRLAEEKGYDFIGCNSEGSNAFFVQKGIAGGLPKPTLEAGYRKSKFRSSIDKRGDLSYLSGSARLAAIQEAEVINLANEQLVKINELGGFSG